ncbi:MAG: hypothetical protein EXS36_13470 [Pedosphaera sp.]|nr:hypothetical protein [Pedosphaera sp.]
MPFPIFAAAEDGVFSFLHTLNGPEFLGLFAAWFALTFVTVLILRKLGRDTPLTSIIGLSCFELLGMLGIIIGSAHGLHTWEYLILMMVLGGVAFLLRVDFKSSADSSGSW